MRIALALGIACVATSASAERLILVPIGNKILFESYRFSTLFDGNRTYQSVLAYGLTREIEVEFEYESFRPKTARESVGFAYNFMNPLTDFAPGATVGVIDALNRTQDGRQFFASATYRYGQSDPYNQDSPMEITFGASLGRSLKPLIAASLPLTWQFRGLVEYDGFRITAGFEFQPLRGVQARWLFRETQTLFGLNWSARF